MISQEQIELEMRLCALEFMLNKISVVALIRHLPAREIDRHLDQLGKDAERQIFSGLDPAQSDMATAEWHLAIQRLIDGQKEEWARVRAKLQG